MKDNLNEGEKPELLRMFKGIDIIDRVETYGFLFIDKENKYWIITPKNTSGFFHADEVEPKSVEQLEFLKPIDSEEIERMAEEKWISVKDRLPDEGGRYWCYVEELNNLGISHFQWNCAYNETEKRFDIGADHVTHWQPLPAPPGNVS